MEGEKKVGPTAEEFAALEREVAASPSAQLILEMCRDALIEHLVQARAEGKSLTVASMLYLERVFVAGAEWNRNTRSAFDPQYKELIARRRGVAEEIAKGVVEKARAKGNGNAS